MQLDALKLLRCPFCGGGLDVRRSPATELTESSLQTGVLGCPCCAYPVLDGIPYLRAGHAARAALRSLDANSPREALFTLLELDGARRERFETLQRDAKAFTFRHAMSVLSPNPEGTYFLYRFSDPTFVASEAMILSVAQDLRCAQGRRLDLCGGTGHLTRTLSGLVPSGEVWLADLEFWKLWLARRFIAPACNAVCCDAAQPLPFSRGSFSLVVCADALHYVWPRRLAVGEMLRLAGQRGVVLALALHNALCDNPSAGSPLEPAAWRGLFDDIPTRLYPESAVLDAVLSRHPVPLSTNYSDAELAAEPALIAVATMLEGLFDRPVVPLAEPVMRRAALNPLYHSDDGAPNKWVLKFPSPDYAEEFAACRRYLPDRLVLTERQERSLSRGDYADELRDLARRRIVLDLPENYL